MSVIIQEQPFDIGRETELLHGGNLVVGAVASFIGYVRDINEGDAISLLTLEYYPGMAEQEINRIIEEARARWALEAARVVHRVGALQPGDQVVWVGVASQHRGDAFAACEFIMDFLKIRAPFWKKEQRADGSSRWLESRESDQISSQKWRS